MCERKLELSSKSTLTDKERKELTSTKLELMIFDV